jgi:hypothetical protein
MTRITQSQVKIAEAIECEGPLTAAQIANAYGARVSNARRAADYMVENNYLTFWDGRYSLTKLGRDDVLLSHAAITLKRKRRNEAQKPVDDAPKFDLFAPVQTEADGFQWSPVYTLTNAPVEPKADPIFDEDDFDDIFPIVTEAVMLDIAGHNISLSVDDAQELRRSLNKFFGGN